MKKLIAGTSVLAALALAAPIAATAHQDGGGRHHMESDMDRDHMDGGHHMQGDDMHRGHMRGGEMHRGDMHGGEGQYGARKGGHRRMRRMMRAMDMIERYDADGDGSVTQEEIDAYRANRLAEFDKDGNGTLSLAEYEALWLDAMHERMVRRFQRHDADGDGQITGAEFSRNSRHMVMMHDRNDDGVLNLDDVARPRGEGRHHE